MKKIITSIIIAAAAFTACVQSNDDVVISNDKVAFSATVESPESRTVLVEEAGKYHAEWTAGDHIELFEVTVTGGTKAKAGNHNTALVEGGKTVKVEFELSAKTADSYIYILTHNDASMNAAGTYLAFTLPHNQAPAALDTFDSLADFIVSKGVESAVQPTETVNFEMARVTALAKVSIKNLALAAGDAVKSVNFACDKVLAGKITRIMVEDLVAGNYPLAQSEVSTPANNAINVTLPEPQTADFSYYMSVWPTTLDAGAKCTVTVVTNNNGVYKKEITLPKVMELVSGEITAFTVNMAGITDSNAAPEEPVEQPAFVEVAGIKWATGNLEYEKDTTTDGFAAGWKIAPAQYHHFNIGLSGDLENLTDYNKVALFNYGGIGDDGSHSFYASGYQSETADTYKYALHLASDGAITDISGKMFTDATCATATTDYAAAKYGDIAYWASNGKYRMPTTAEFDKLYTDACYAKATYNDGVNTISGTYFYNPAEGETAGEVVDTKVVTADDLAVGLFLPWVGRGYDNADYKIYGVNAQGVYRTSTVNVNSKGDGLLGYGGIYRVQSNERDYYNKTVRTKDPKTYAYGACARYAIRPIYIGE